MIIIQNGRCWWRWSIFLSKGKLDERSCSANQRVPTGHTKIHTHIENTNVSKLDIKFNKDIVFSCVLHLCVYLFICHHLQLHQNHHHIHQQQHHHHHHHYHHLYHHHHHHHPHTQDVFTFGRRPSLFLALPIRPLHMDCRTDPLNISSSSSSVLLSSSSLKVITIIIINIVVIIINIVVVIIIINISPNSYSAGPPFEQLLWQLGHFLWRRPGSALTSLIDLILE